MAKLRLFSEMPLLNTGTVLLLGSEKSWREQLAEAMFQLPKSFELKTLTNACLTLRCQPRIDLIVFINLRSADGLATVRHNIRHLDPHFFLCRVYFLAASGGLDTPRVLEEADIRKLADTYHCNQMNNEDNVQTVAGRLLHLLAMSAGQVPGATTLSLALFTKRP